MKLYLLYGYEPKTRLIETVNGEVPFIDWIQEEMRRIKTANPNRVVMIDVQGTNAALFVNDTGFRRVGQTFQFKASIDV